MSRIINVITISLILLDIMIIPAFGGETAHYINGVAGIRAASLPPPGYYYRMYNLIYDANEMTDKFGEELNLDFDLKVYSMAHRFLWVSKKKILGVNYFANILIPLIDTDIKVKAPGMPEPMIDESKFDIGDIFIEPIGLTRYGKRCDLSFGLAVFAPTGKYDKDDPASPGKDFWTGIASLGGTVYFDAKKTWAASILSRYEIHSEKDDTDVRAGDDFHFEWGISKMLTKCLEIGLSGYCQWQVTDDSGSDAQDKDVHDRVFAVGPEAEFFVPAWKSSVSLRSQWEFESEDRSEGNVTVLTLSKSF